MFDSTIISIVQIVVSVLLVAAILIQKGEGGLGTAFGGGGGSSYHTKRGFEKGLFIATIVLGILFVALAISALLVK